jgi:hypothetical protein
MFGLGTRGIDGGAMTTYITATTQYVLWVKKRNCEGALRWYPKRRITHDFALVCAQAEIDYGDDFVMLPQGMNPRDEWLAPEQPVAASALYSVWTEGKATGDNKQRIGEGLDQKAAQDLKMLTEASPMALGLRVWTEEEK